MARPSVGSFAESMYAAMEPLTYADEEFDWSLLKFLESFGQMFQEIEDLVRDTSEGDPGWSVIMDLFRAPDKFLPWLGQLIGVQLPTSGLTEQERRDRIEAAAGFKRGTPNAMVAAAQQYLTGLKRVTLFERDTSAYHLTVNTYAAETPNSDYVLNALISQKPAGLILVYNVVGGQLYSDVLSKHPDYQDVTNDNATYRILMDTAP